MVGLPQLCPQRAERARCLLLPSPSEGMRASAAAPVPVHPRTAVVAGSDAAASRTTLRPPTHMQQRFADGKHASLSPRWSPRLDSCVQTSRAVAGVIPRSNANTECVWSLPRTLRASQHYALHLVAQSPPLPLGALISFAAASKSSTGSLWNG
jgi:hypothetical protein